MKYVVKISFFKKQRVNSQRGLVWSREAYIHMTPKETKTFYGRDIHDTLLTSETNWVKEAEYEYVSNPDYASHFKDDMDAEEHLEIFLNNFSRKYARKEFRYIEILKWEEPSNSKNAQKSASVPTHKKTKSRLRR